MPMSSVTTGDAINSVNAAEAKKTFHVVSSVILIGTFLMLRVRSLSK
jgi:hypothetical protein